MSRRIVFILVPVVLVLVLVAYWFLLLNPLFDSISAREREIDQNRRQLASLEAKLSQLSQLKEDAARNEARLVELSKMVPTSEQLPSLLLQIQDLAAQSGIEFLTISPGQPTEAPGFQKIPLSLKFKGTFFDVNDFIYRTEQLAAGPGRLLAVGSVSLSPDGEPTSTKVSPKLSADITLYAFERNPNLEPKQEKATQATEPIKVE